MFCCRTRCRSEDSRDRDVDAILQTADIKLDFIPHVDNMPTRVGAMIFVIFQRGNTLLRGENVFGVHGPAKKDIVHGP